MKITIVGHVCIDNNVSEHSTYTTAGSPAMFMDKAYKRFPDVVTSIIAPYGVDFLTYTQGINIFPTKPIYDWTLIYENKSQGNIRSQKALNRGYAGPVPLEDKLRKIVSESDVVFFAPLTPDYSIQYISDLMNSTKANSLKILLPQGYCRSFDKNDNVIQRDFIEADSIISLFDVVIVSEKDHGEIRSIAQKWSAKTQVIMTLGDNGSSYMYHGETVTASVEQVNTEDIIDSVGSGDIFSASFGYKYYITKDVKKSLEFANNIARQCLFLSVNNLRFNLPE